MIDPHLVLGGPGCGKTTRLLEIMERELDRGISPDQIAFVTFTRAAAAEARERAAEKFHLDPDADLPWVRTIHSLAYRALGITRDEVMEGRDWTEFSKMMGQRVTGRYDTDGYTFGGSGGDKLLRIIDYAATTMRGLVEVFHELDEPVDWWTLRQFDHAFSRYKSDVAKMDFTDMLLAYINEGEPLDLKVAIVDEAQDLTRAQWQVVHRAFERAERVYVGGDDDQAIYRWAGADVDYFLSLSDSPEILNLSHRLPRTIYEAASRISGQISKRYAKPYRPDPGREGEVVWHMGPTDVDLSKEGTWLLLARNTYMLKDLEEHARNYGVSYSRRSGPAIKPEHVDAAKLWERLRTGKQSDMSAGEVRLLFREGLDRKLPQLRELTRYTLEGLGIEDKRPWHEALTGISRDRRDYYTSCLRRGEKLSGTPRVRIETIHGVKGSQADHVLLMTDFSRRTARSFQASPDHEHRVFYVGTTRARESLHLVAPTTMTAYPMGR